VNVSKGINIGSGSVENGSNFNSGSVVFDVVVEFSGLSGFIKKSDGSLIASSFILISNISKVNASLRDEIIPQSFLIFSQGTLGSNNSSLRSLNDIMVN